jgi:hypothetical protein
MEHATQFTMDAAETLILLGKDEGANPVEYLLHSLAACVTTSMVSCGPHGIEIEAVESKFEGDLDLCEFLGIDPPYGMGYERRPSRSLNKSAGTRPFGCEGNRMGSVFRSKFYGNLLQVSLDCIFRDSKMLRYDLV